MATFSTNQVRHLYVANATKTSPVLSTDVSGTIAVKGDAAKTHFYFEYKTPSNLTRSDLIVPSQVTSAKASDATTMVYNLKKYKLTLDTTVNSGAPLANQDYILRLAFRSYVGLGVEDQYFKYGAVHATTGMTASTFYKTLALSLFNNFSREASSLLNFYLETGGTDPAVVAGTPILITASNQTLSGTYTGLIIEEAAQPWVLGKFPQLPVDFSILPTTITVGSDELIWGISNKVTSTTFVQNGIKTADAEYFFLGERGDQYRYMGFPNNFTATYLVDPTIKYNWIDITYHYRGNGEDPQRSQKVITIVVPKIGATNSVSNVLTNSIITAINTASGLSIAALGLETS